MFHVIGQYRIERDGEIIRVWSSPEFNLEAAHQYALDMLAQIREMPARFGVLVNFDAPPIVGPEVEASMRESALERAARGMVAVAFVTDSQEAVAVARAQWQRIYVGSGVEWEMFGDARIARGWLQARLDAG